MHTRKTANPTTLVLALVAGAGLIVMMVALASGSIQGAEAQSTGIGMAFAIGVVLFVLGVGGWLAVVRPYRHFDDINVPVDTGHHGHDTHDKDTEHAIEPVNPHAESHS